ncbi:MAG: formyltetrahydrofolate deformylase [Thermodesulfobacteriota bacterium]
MSQNTENSAILLVYCPDRTGLVSSITEFIFKNGGNIIDLDQHVDIENKVFFMRVEWSLDDFAIPKEKIGEFFNTLIGEKYDMNWEIHFSEDVPRMAIFVSKLSHCLYDILSRTQSAEWKVNIPLIISNHPDLEEVAKKFDIDYHQIKIGKENKADAEAEQLKLLKEYNIDFIVLARYMQILTDNFVKNYPNKIINIHHSFLPAFAGAKPYHSAHERGVKIIGATSHYATAELDAGPIIEQDIIRVSHTDSVEDLVRKGKDLEKIVLSRAIWSHLKRNVLVFDNRTVVFNG